MNDSKNKPLKIKIHYPTTGPGVAQARARKEKEGGFVVIVYTAGRHGHDGFIRDVLWYSAGYGNNAEVIARLHPAHDLRIEVDMVTLTFYA